MVPELEDEDEDEYAAGAEEVDDATGAIVDEEAAEEDVWTEVDDATGATVVDDATDDETYVTKVDGWKAYVEEVEVEIADEVDVVVAAADEVYAAGAFSTGEKAAAAEVVEVAGVDSGSSETQTVWVAISVTTTS